LASSIALLSRLPAFSLSSVSMTWISISIILVGLWSAARVMLASDLSSALPFFLSGFGSLQIYCVIEHQAGSALLWGCLALFIGSSLGTFLKYRRFLSILPSLVLVLAIGIPFTLGGMGLTGLIKPFSGFSAFIVVILLGLLVGVGRLIWQMQIIKLQVDQPITIVYMVGLLVLPISTTILGAKMSGIFIPNPNLVLSGILMLVGVLAGGVYYRVLATYHPQETENSFIRLVRQVQAIGKWNLPGRFMQALIRLLDIIVRLITNILEGDGGFLWTLVLLAVMISVISPGGG
jgi:hypothetical protein